MKKWDGWKELAAAAALACCFWNMVYPEFALTGDSYRKEVSCEKEENAGQEPGTREMRNRADYYEILNASEGEVEIRFGFLEGCASECSKSTQTGKERPVRRQNGRRNDDRHTGTPGQAGGGI